MKSARVKSYIKKMSAKLGIDAQELWQMYFLEKVLERVSVSSYKSNFILKGGLLIASMIGVMNRSTRDIDATIKSYSLNNESIEKMLNDIFEIELDDGIKFSLQSIRRIRTEDKYGGFRGVVLAKFERIEQHIKIDISTGDEITPKEVKYDFLSSFGNNSINIMSYNIETILAEKLESILSKVDLTTRMRDYYDVYVLRKLYHDQIDLVLLRKAFIATITHRGTQEIIDIIDELLELIKDSLVLKEHWLKYQKKYTYVKNISFNDTINQLEMMLVDMHVYRA